MMLATYVVDIFNCEKFVFSIIDPSTEGFVTVKVSIVTSLDIHSKARRRTK